MTEAATKSVQEEYAPKGICFGCGPANHKGLRIRSFEEGDELVCEFDPAEQHQAFPGVLNGGILGSLLDCHMNWAAALHVKRRDNLDQPPCTVTAEFTVKLKRPAPLAKVKLTARIVNSEGSKTWVEAELVSTATDKVCATSTGLFVAVDETHPAYHRW